MGTVNYLGLMVVAKRKIEIAEAVAAELESRAAAEGTNITTLVARFLDADREPFSLSRVEIADLDRQWDEIQTGAPTIPHEDVEAWLRTWGTPDFKPWDGP